MKRIAVMLIAFCIFASTAFASDFIDSSKLKKFDVVQLIKKDNNGKTAYSGYVIKDFYLGVALVKKKGEKAKTALKKPRSEIKMVYFKDADNESYVDGLKAFTAKKYNIALDYFADATANSTNFSDPKHKNWFMQYINYYSGLCNYRLGEYDLAINNFDAALRQEDAIFKFEAEYYQGRALEAKGNYKNAINKYARLSGTVYPKMLKTAKWGEKYDFLCKLGLERATLLGYTQQKGKEAAIKSTLAKFDDLLKKNSQYVTDEVKLEGVMVRSSAGIYLAQKDPAQYSKIVKMLKLPINVAIAENNSSALAWMYQNLADCYYGMMENAKAANKKKEMAEAARTEYMRVTYLYNTSPNDMAKSYFRLGELFEMLKGKDWQKWALINYKKAASSKYKSATEIHDKAKEAKTRMEAAIKAATK